MSFGDDHAAGIPPDVDDDAEIVVGVVLRVATAFLVTFRYALAPQGSLLIVNPVTLIEVFLHLLIFQFDGNSHSWWSEGRILGDARLDFRSSYWACIHVVGEVFIKIIRVVVVKIDSLQRMII